MHESFMELVYLSIQGELIPEYAIKDVENIFEEGAVGVQLYQNVRNAYNRICDRLGAKDEDPDLNELVTSLEALNREISLRMYLYGAKFGLR